MRRNIETGSAPNFLLRLLFLEEFHNLMGVLKYLLTRHDGISRVSRLPALPVAPYPFLTFNGKKYQRGNTDTED